MEIYYTHRLEVLNPTGDKPLKNAQMTRLEYLLDMFSVVPSFGAPKPL